MKVELHAVQHIPYDGIIPFSYDNIKKCFPNSEYIRENVRRRKELFELPILESGDFNLKACAFRFLIVLLLSYNTLFYFNLYSSLTVANGLCIYILLNINIEKLKIKALQLLYSFYS